MNNHLLRSIFIVLFLSFRITDCLPLSYHGANGQRGHRDDFAAVLPFEWNDHLEEWGKCITDVLDQFVRGQVPEYGGLTTYQYFKQEFGLKMGAGDHRWFFHWGYQTLPWNDSIVSYLPHETVNDSLKLQSFKTAVKNEQARRNRLANTLTEKYFGFSSAGRQSKYANAFITIIYDVHLLGDYETPNIRGLAPVSVIVAELCRSIDAIDNCHSSELKKDIKVCSRNGTEREKAASVLACLRASLPDFIYQADDGFVNMKNHFKNLGFSFRQESKSSVSSLQGASFSKTENDDSIVALTATGRCYHKKTCHFVVGKNNIKLVTASEAESMGKKPGRCCF